MQPSEEDTETRQLQEVRCAIRDEFRSNQRLEELRGAIREELQTALDGLLPKLHSALAGLPVGAKCGEASVEDRSSATRTLQERRNEEPAFQDTAKKQRPVNQYAWQGFLGVNIAANDDGDPSAVASGQEPRSNSERKLGREVEGNGEEALNKESAIDEQDGDLPKWQESQHKWEEEQVIRKD
jgi:hypothetical protein